MRNDANLDQKIETDWSEQAIILQEKLVLVAQERDKVQSLLNETIQERDQVARNSIPNGSATVPESPGRQNLYTGLSLK